MKRNITGFTIGFIFYFIIATILDIIGVESLWIKGAIALLIGFISLLIDKYYFIPKREDKKVN